MSNLMSLEKILRGVTRSGRLNFISEAPRLVYNGSSYHAINVQCDCGNQKVVAAGQFRNGKVVSCGCLRIERAKEGVSKASRKHGHAKTYSSSPTYKSWSCMRTRCLNKKSNMYGGYGAMGVSVCERWNSFANFLEDMGERPLNKTLDRIDPRGNYSPDNCKWSTAEEQMNNRRDTKFIVIYGEKISYTMAFKRLGIAPQSGTARLKSGYHPYYAITVPMGEMKKWMKIDHPEFRLPDGVT